jgi:hypothetical protein
MFLFLCHFFFFKAAGKRILKMDADLAMKGEERGKKRGGFGDE